MTMFSSTVSVGVRVGGRMCTVIVVFHRDIAVRVRGVAIRGVVFGGGFAKGTGTAEDTADFALLPPQFLIIDNILSPRHPSILNWTPPQPQSSIWDPGGRRTLVFRWGGCGDLCSGGSCGNGGGDGVRKVHWCHCLVSSVVDVRK